MHSLIRLPRAEGNEGVQSSITQLFITQLFITQLFITQLFITQLFITQCFIAQLSLLSLQFKCPSPRGAGRRWPKAG